MPGIVAHVQTRAVPGTSEGVCAWGEGRAVKLVSSELEGEAWELSLLPPWSQCSATRLFAVHPHLIWLHPAFGCRAQAHQQLCPPFFFPVCVSQCSNRLTGSRPFFPRATAVLGDCLPLSHCGGVYTGTPNCEFPEFSREKHTYYLGTIANNRNSIKMLSG